MDLYGLYGILFTHSTDTYLNHAASTICHIFRTISDLSSEISISDLVEWETTNQLRQGA